LPLSQPQLPEKPDEKEPFTLLAKLWGQHDKRLWLETVWFGVVNAGTMWLFLHRGFEWEQEPGNVQRFMW
jgi:hypothetical protein